MRHLPPVGAMNDGRFGAAPGHLRWRAGCKRWSGLNDRDWAGGRPAGLNMLMRIAAVRSGAVADYRCRLNFGRLAPHWLSERASFSGRSNSSTLRSHSVAANTPSPV